MELYRICHAVETMINRGEKEGGLKATVYTAVKNNDTRRAGVILETPGINLSPTIYLEEFYEKVISEERRSMRSWTSCWRLMKN